MLDSVLEHSGYLETAESLTFRTFLSSIRLRWLSNTSGGWLYRFSSPVYPQTGEKASALLDTLNAIVSNENIDGTRQRTLKASAETVTAIADQMQSCDPMLAGSLKNKILPQLQTLAASLHLDLNEPRTGRG